VDEIRCCLTSGAMDGMDSEIRDDDCSRENASESDLIAIRDSYEQITVDEIRCCLTSGAMDGMDSEIRDDDCSRDNASERVT
jgi:hypothetical protein